MKDIRKLYDDCCMKLDSIGIHVPNEKLKGLRVSSRMTRAYGTCRHWNATGEFVITISDRLLADNVPNESAENTMIHELLHAVYQGDHHGGRWATAAEKVNRELGYNIQRCSSYNEMHMERPAYLYNFRCEKCGETIGRNKRSRFVQNPSRYIHNGCGGHFQRV